MAFFYNKPKISTKIFNVGSAVDGLQAFNAMYQFDGAGVDACPDMSDADRASWRKAVRENVINLGGTPTDLDFFEKFAGGKTTDVDASTLYIKYRQDKDYNVVAESDVTGSGPGQPVNFTMLKSIHSLNGQYSNAAIGGNIYCYEDGQWLVITAVNKTTPYAHVITAVPFSQFYTANIRKGRKMMYNPVRLVDGYSCHQPSNSWETPGYVSKIQPFNLRKDWELAIDLTRPYEEVMQFAIMFDNNGREVDSYELFEKTKAREEFRSMKNLAFMFGQKKDNPLLLAGSNMGSKYSGFMGYLPTLQYGGGTIYDVDPSQGFGFDDDFQSVIIHQDSTKRSKEFMVPHGLQWMFSTQRRNEEVFKNQGGCSYESFTRMGADKSEITKLGITSYKYGNYSLHFREVDAWSDRRYIGNGPMPYMAIFMPTMGMTDSKGKSVPPIEFFNPGGHSTYLEIDRDHRRLESGCDKLSGELAETIMMAVHGQENHILINPVFPAA